MPASALWRDFQLKKGTMDQDHFYLQPLLKAKVVVSVFCSWTPSFPLILEHIPGQRKELASTPICFQSFLLVLCIQSLKI